jgi:hypothetical protein
MVQGNFTMGFLRRSGRLHRGGVRGIGNLGGAVKKIWAAFYWA